MMSRRAFLIATGCGVVAGRLPAHAQSFPGGLVRIIVPFPPGGGTDVLGRLLSSDLQLVYSLIPRKKSVEISYRRFDQFLDDFNLACISNPLVIWIRSFDNARVVDSGQNEFKDILVECVSTLCCYFYRTPLRHHWCFFSEYISGKMTETETGFLSVQGGCDLLIVYDPELAE